MYIHSNSLRNVTIQTVCLGGYEYSSIQNTECSMQNTAYTPAKVV